MPYPHEFHGPNEGYVLELYERYLAEPDSLDAHTRRFFDDWTPPGNSASNGGSAPIADVSDLNKIRGAVNYAQAIRLYGHMLAQLDPLNANPPQSDPELNPEAHGITKTDLANIPASFIGGPVTSQAANALEATEALLAIYAHTTGVDIDHIRIPEERIWLRDAFESRRYRFKGTQAEARHMLERLTQIEQFEHFLQRTFPTKYRFSVEGLDTMVPMLDEVVRLADEAHIQTAVLAMAHRGRLNVLAHIMNRPYAQILAEFKDPLKLQEMRDAIGWTVGDVKYHKGVETHVNIDDDQHHITLLMPPNPSHLEFVNPVAVGMARAAGDSRHQPGEPAFDPGKTIQILIHGDAAFPGQGIVAETFNLSRLPGYWAGGTLHLIANNQLGFTTLPKDSRSTLYASDLAKGFKVPIVHVNADDPAACIEVVRIAFAYLEEFEKDFLIDLIGYRRYGHNELDEPGFTQPLLYDRIRSHPTVRELWVRRLVSAEQITVEEAETIIQRFSDHLQAEYDALEERKTEELAEVPPPEPPRGVASTIETAISEARLRDLNDGLLQTLEGFNFLSTRFEKTIRARRSILDDLDAPLVDWATAEEMAFASVVADGIPVRLTGQDSERGTFSHRHAVLYDRETGQPMTPLQHLAQARATFEVRNSPLSECAVLGFEFGYDVQAQDTLVLWEAQYGDFNNGAQVIIDEFIVSAREKWGQTPALTLLLPHGHEGAGPDHSSARLERFLAMAAKTNMRIVNCTTASQYFHLLRRQALLLGTDRLPLIVMSPKSLLRNPNVSSPARDFIEGRWQPVLDDPTADPQTVTRLVFCSGKFYWDLVTSDYRDQHPEVALVRVEQLYPFPHNPLQEIIARYPNVNQIVWAQEEPKNMGAWEFMGYRLKKLVGINMPVNYVGRRRSASPAEGSKTAYQVNQAMITQYAFNWKFR